MIAVDVLDEKLTNAKLLGATHTVNAKSEDAVERIKVCIAKASIFLFFFNLHRNFLVFHPY